MQITALQKRNEENTENTKNVKKLPLSSRSAYVSACQDYSSAFPDWNEAFQLTWELEDNTEALANRRFIDLRKIEVEFKKDISLAVKNLVDANFCLPISNYSFVSKDIHGLQYKEQNVFYQVLKDVHTGKRYIESLRGILLGGADHLSVPLSAIVVYRGLPFLAQALAPLESVVHNSQEIITKEIEESIRTTSISLNVPLPEHVHCCVNKGSDGRYYVVSTNATTIPLVVTELEPPLQRCEMLLSPFAPLAYPVSTTMNNVLHFLKAPALISAVRTIGLTAPSTGDTLRRAIFCQSQQNRLCAILHFFGINLVFLPLLLGTCQPTRHCQECVAEAWDNVKRVIGIEILSRTIKSMFYKLCSADRMLGGNKAQKNLSRSIQWGLQEPLQDNSIPNAYSCSTDHVFRKFCTDPMLLSETADLLETCRKHCVETIVSRVCILVGIRKEKAEDTKLIWEPVQKGQLVPRLACPQVQRYWAAAGTENKADSFSTDDSTPLGLWSKFHELVFWSPLFARWYLWKGNDDKCLEIEKESLVTVKAILKLLHGRSSKKSLNEFASFPSASLVHLRLFFTHIQSLFLSKHPQNTVQGCALMPTFLDEAKQCSVNNLVLAKYHIRFGCFILGLKNWTEDGNTEAARHFAKAESLIPMSFRDYFSARLYLQACFGILHCDLDFSSNGALISGVSASKSLLEKLIQRAMILIKNLKPTEQVVEYLWKLGLEVGNQRIRMFLEGVTLLTRAVEMVKQIPNSRISKDVLTKDLLELYSFWNENKYKSYCDQLGPSSVLPVL